MLYEWLKRENQIKINNLKNYKISDMHAIAKVSSSNKVVVPENLKNITTPQLQV